MRFVVLHAHPLEECLSVDLRDRVVHELEVAGHEVLLVQLTQGEEISADELAGSDGVVFVYPTWWGGLPAPMLGWVQQELAGWIDGGAPAATSPLRTVRHLVAVTTHGSSGWVNRLQGEPGRQLLKRTIARLCHRGTRLQWIALYGIDRCEPPEVARFLERVGRRVAAFAR